MSLSRSQPSGYAGACTARRGWATLAVVIMLLIPSGGSSQQGARADEGALYLLLPVGAQGVGLGRAMTALANEEGAFWNPASIAEQEQRRLLVYRGDQLAGEATAVSAVFPWENVATIGFSYLLFDYGEQSRLDEFKNVLGTITFRDHLAIASFATSISQRVHAGVNFKLVRRQFDCRGQCLDLESTGTAYAIDLGIQSEPFPGIPLRLGAMLAHLGTDLKTNNQAQADGLPVRLRVAAAYRVMDRAVENAPVRLWLTVESEDRARDLGSPSVFFGANLEAADLFYLRAGYVEGELDQTNGAAVGVGFKFDRFDLNVAKSLTRNLTGDSDPIHVSFGVVF